MLLLPICLLFFFTLVVIVAKSSIEVKPMVTRTLLACFYISALLAIASAFLFYHKIYFISDFLNKTVIWYPIFFAGLIVATSRALTNRVHKFFIYAFFMMGFLFLSLTFIPFLGASVNAYFASSSGKIYYSDDLILVQESYYGILSMPRPPDVYRKKFGVFVIQETSKLRCEANTNIRVIVEKEKNYFIVRYLNEDGSENCSTKLLRD